MRKALLTLLVLSGITWTAFGQGTLIFSNSPASLVTIRYSEWDPNHLVPAMPGYYDEVELLFAVPGTPSSPLGFGESISSWLARNPGWTVGPSVRLSTNGLGLFNGGLITLSGVGPGSEISYHVYGQTDHWMNDQEPGWYLGLSDVFATRTGLDALSAVPLTESFTGLELLPVNLLPEPSVAALAVAFGVLFAVRRVRTRLS